MAVVAKAHGGSADGVLDADERQRVPRVRLALLDADSGCVPVAMATEIILSCRRARSAELALAESDALGQFRFDELDVARVRVRVALDSLVRVTHSRTLVRVCACARARALPPLWLTVAAHSSGTRTDLPLRSTASRPATRFRSGRVLRRFGDAQMQLIARAGARGRLCATLRLTLAAAACQQQLCSAVACERVALMLAFTDCRSVFHIPFPPPPCCLHHL